MDAIRTEASKTTANMNSGIASGYTTIPDDPVRVRQVVDEAVDEAVENLHRRVAYIKGEYERSLARNNILSKSKQNLRKQLTELTHRVRDLDVQLGVSRDDLAVSENKIAASDEQVRLAKRKLKRAEKKLKFTSNRLEREREFFSRREKTRAGLIQRLGKDVQRAEDVAIRRRRDVDIGNLCEQVEEYLSRSSGVLADCPRDNAIVTLLTQLMKEQYKRENLEDQLFDAQDQIANYRWRELTMSNSTEHSDTSSNYYDEAVDDEDVGHQDIKIEDDESMFA